ncbi:hypothetical protein [Paenibacillus wenxiniae]|uniref:Uncharacterized protein n=1 Tax=Paenibacillus wenxiniae TaxID=1636843 RepID=A0ABW4RLH5_9BACL
MIDPNPIVIKENITLTRQFSPYFFYRYGTAVQFEQARQLYYKSLTAPQQQQFDQAVTRFQMEPNSRIGRGEIWPYLTVLAMNERYKDE